MIGSGRRNEDINLLLLKQQIPYMLNVSHYMTDLVYVLYYTIKLQDNEQEIIELEGRKTMLCDEIYRLREHFRILLNRSSGSILGIIQEDTNEKEDVTIDKDNESKEEIWRLIQQFKNLITEELLQIVNDINRLIIEKLNGMNSNNDDENIKKLVIQLDNCFYGFLNLNNFIRRIPSSKTFNSDNQDSMKSIVHVIKDELLLSWKIELDLLNCKIFSLISTNEKILNLFRQYQVDNGQTPIEIKKQDNMGSIKEDSEAFIQLISWLKDDQVFGSLVL
ncbi:hypothetical protein C6P45_000252 [Maudiozyma exigua]|uniref:Uncharacterized protein n=1 Tax=Maudiozyma exigua TaxID=34358 RepID=A0A9P7B9Y0_MAUEX|nr:hypothetical protein C6P45_000252 [Kazachstania exigua]